MESIVRLATWCRRETWARNRETGHSLASPRRASGSPVSALLAVSSPVESLALRGRQDPAREAPKFCFCDHCVRSGAGHPPWALSSSPLSREGAGHVLTWFNLLYVCDLGVDFAWSPPGSGILFPHSAEQPCGQRLSLNPSSPLTLLRGGHGRGAGDHPGAALPLCWG